MSFSFGAATTTAASTFGTTTPSTGFAFGSGDPAKQGLFGSNNAENKPAFNFTSPSGGGFAFGAAKTTAPTSSLFSTPTTTSAASAFGASKPVSFGGFTSPPNQTVGSPGFGQSAPQNLSFGASNQQQQQQQQPAPAFGTPSTQATTGFGASPSSGFGFGSSPATTGFGAAPATTGSSFGAAPATTGTGFGAAPATTGFGFSTPASGFSAPQTSTATPATTSAPQTSQSFLGGSAPGGFGQSAFGAKPAFSFGGGTTAAPAFGTATATPSFALPNQQQQQQQPTTTQTGLSFGTSSAPSGTTTGLSSGMGLGLGTKPAAPLFEQSIKSPAQEQTKNLFGSPITSTPASSGAGLSFGTAPTSTQPQTGLSFSSAQTSAATGLSFGTVSSSAPAQQTTGLSFGVPSTANQAANANRQATTTSTAMFSSNMLGQASGGQFPKTSHSIGGSITTPSTSAQPTTAVSSSSGLAWSAAPATTGQTSLSFATSTAAAPVLSFGATSTAASTMQSGFSLSGTSGSSVLGFGKPVTAVASSAASTTAPSGITALGKTTAATTMASLTTATTTTAAAPPQMITSITFAQLEENINKWTLELEEQEKTFINQATQINAWDRLLIANGEKIVELNDAVQSVKNEQQSLEHELDFVLAQQKELEDLLAPMEKQLSEETVDRLRDPEREHMYSLAENLDTQLRQMSEDLKEVIEHLNETNRSQDSNDPIVQIGRILNAHMSSMQWIDNSIAQISTKLDQLKATHDTLRRDNERSYQMTYN